MERYTDLTIVLCWDLVGAVFLLGLLFTKRTVRAQSHRARLFHLALLLLGFFLLGSRRFHQGWLGMRFLEAAPALQFAGAALTLAGCLFTIWARIALGSNWSGRVTVKADHQLIVKGPYALVRHPIYTGLLTAALGTGLAIAEWRCLLGFALILTAVTAKIGQEERMMLETFPDQYPLYRQRVKALIPGLL